MPIPPRVSVVALRTADLARSTAFYGALGWELSPASTAAMSLSKTAGSLLLVCTDELLTELGGPRWPPPWRASRPAKPSCPFTWPPTARLTPGSRRLPKPAGLWPSGPRPPRARVTAAVGERLSSSWRWQRPPSTNPGDAKRYGDHAASFAGRRR